MNDQARDVSELLFKIQLFRTFLSVKLLGPLDLWGPGEVACFTRKFSSDKWLKAKKVMTSCGPTEVCALRYTGTEKVEGLNDVTIVS